MNIARLVGGAAALCALAGAAVLVVGVPARGIDLQDSSTLVSHPAADIVDTYFFPSPTNPDNIVAVMDVNPLIPAGSGLSTYFDQQVVYAMKFDNNYASEAASSTSTTTRPIENVEIQFSFSAPGNNTQQVFVYGPSLPLTTGTTQHLLNGGVAQGTGFINRPFQMSVAAGTASVFVGARRDPQFFNASQFWQIFPDRNQGSTAASCLSSSCPTGFTAAGGDYFAGSNVLSIVIEMPKGEIAGNSGAVVAYWATTSTKTGK